MKVALVACGKQKRQARSQAADLYTSPLFRMTRKLVEASGFDRWFILSARYGILDPVDEVEPYEHKLQAKERQAWGKLVAAKLVEKLGDAATELHVFAGKEYADPLKNEGLNIVEPLAGLQIGQRLAFLKNANNKGN